MSHLNTTQTFGQNNTYKQDAFDKSKINVYDFYGNLVKTIKNENINTPYSSVINRITTNYNNETMESRLIIYTTVTLDYEELWKNVYQALIDTALRTDLILD